MRRWLSPIKTLFAPSTESLSAQIDHLRWQLPLYTLFLVVAYHTVEHYWLAASEEFSFISEVIIYGAGIPLVMWATMGWIKNQIASKEAAQQSVIQAHEELTHLNRHISFLLKANQRLGKALDKNSLSALAIQLPLEVTPAIVGCALIRFDEHQQPMPVAHHGEIEEAVLVAWHRNLSAAATRQQCQACRVHTARNEHGGNCPLLKNISAQDIGGIVCLRLERNQTEFGSLGLFLAADTVLTDEEYHLLESVAAEISIAFESIRLRTRELATFYELNEALQMRLDLNGLMSRLLARTVESSQADAGLLLLQDADGKLIISAKTGDWEKIGRLALIESLAAGSLHDSNGEAVILTLGDQHTSLATLLCAPIITDGTPLGVIVLGSSQTENFMRQQMRLVSAIAAQAGLLAQNARLYTRLEHQAIITERGRLAREMHDGLAQTLGYLKMRANQIAQWIETQQTERAALALHELAQTANDAYLDLRAALDGLRSTVNTQGDAAFAAQLQRCVADFQHQSNLLVDLTIESEPDLSGLAQAHLLRIIQESLANIRKHAHASHVAIALTPSRLRISDDGQGFDAGANLPERCHGLRAMRERTDLFNANLQVVSAPGKGTQVEIEWNP
ncbi:MAG: GAF domain-containing protein [Chloroflexi bacterium]|nr:GAF domain-containing protein [Chloroflexota bacterium]